MKKNDYLIIYEDCRIIDGFKNSIIYDLTRPTNSNYIPKSLNNFLKKCKDAPLIDVLSRYKNCELQYCYEYIEFILENEFGCIVNEHLKNQLTAIKFKNSLPSEKINNAIICINQANFHYAIKVIETLNKLFCSHIELRVQNLDSDKLDILFKSFENSAFETILYRTKFLNEGYNKKLLNLIINEIRVIECLIYKSPVRLKKGIIRQITNDADFINDCGEITQLNFSINLNFFTESYNCNTCLHKKIALDFTGEIKNCPSMKKSYGNIKDTTLEEAINKQGFKDLWSIKKDEIKVCQDCEFRHMCMDCRAYIDNPKDIYSHPAKCNYNPYLAKWKGEEGYVPVLKMSQEEIQSIKTENA